MSTLANKPAPPFGILEGCEQTLSARTGFSIPVSLRAQALVSDLHSNSSLEMVATVTGALQRSRPATRRSKASKGTQNEDAAFQKSRREKTEETERFGIVGGEVHGAGGAVLRVLRRGSHSLRHFPPAKESSTIRYSQLHFVDLCGGGETAVRTAARLPLLQSFAVHGATA